MANAGNIKAIGFDGTFIRNLQSLDSSNIGVGVSYVAPNPLDDKKFDYIQYTDKNGVVQKLTDENEILIYATNGTIKNFTLINDDTNEAIGIQWTDVFGSNWKKTVVRYSTSSYPSSATSGTLAVEETVQNTYSTNAYSLTGLEDGITYYFTAFALDESLNVISTQQMSITPEFRLPSIYQEVFNDGTRNDTKLKSDGWLGVDGGNVGVAGVGTQYGMTATSSGLAFRNTSTDRGAVIARQVVWNKMQYSKIHIEFSGVKSNSRGGVMFYLRDASGNTIIGIQSNYINSNAIYINGTSVLSKSYTASLTGEVDYDITTGEWSGTVDGVSGSGKTSTHSMETDLYLVMELSKGYYGTPSNIYYLTAIFS